MDGFNLYHSVAAAARLVASRERRPTEDERKTKWLDLRSLVVSYLPLFGRDAVLDRIWYFSALAHHMEKRRPGTVKRHEDYLRCLSETGVIVEMSRFKKKELKCPCCRNTYVSHEEKETDVAVAIKLLEALHEGSCERLVLVTGDTDVSPAVRAGRRLFPGCKIHFLFPWDRKTKQLSKLSDGSHSISLENYLKHQLPDPMRLENGTAVPKPISW